MKAVRLLILLLGATALVGLFLWLKPKPELQLPLPSPALPAEAVTATQAPPMPKPVEFSLQIAHGKPLAPPASLQVQQGSTVLLKISSDHDDQLHLHGYDLSLPIKAGQPAELQFLADRSGRFDLELHHAGIELGALEVLP